MGSGPIAFLDAFTRVSDTLHRTLPGVTQEELLREPHPSIGWLAWRLTRVMDNNFARLSNREQLWLADGWATRFGMKGEPYDFTRGAAHTREQVTTFEATAELLLAYHEAVFELTKTYLAGLSDEELARELDEPQYTPLPTVSVRVVSVLENAMYNAGMICYLKGYHHLGGWFPVEGSAISAYR
jgi:hypothetical protein